MSIEVGKVHTYLWIHNKGGSEELFSRSCWKEGVNFALLFATCYNTTCCCWLQVTSYNILDNIAVVAVNVAMLLPDTLR